MARPTDDDFDQLVPDDDPEVIAGMAALAVLRSEEGEVVDLTLGKIR
ncbi:hypothetical protein QMG83_14540 [Salinibacterium sp. G-O1]|nr:hypothetical protein [Salinibacterium sp. G-O1]MDJ0336442.1 hypothetical protein [Salinibacterium sp. G-O1]